MKSMILSLFLLFLGIMPLSARSLFIAPWGNDSDEGSYKKPLRTLSQAQRQIEAGDTVWIRGGRYFVDDSQAMNRWRNYLCVFDLSKSGTSERPICYFAWPKDERPVFDFAQIRPDSLRVSAFFIGGDWLHLKGFDIVGVQVNIKGHTQSECISAKGGSNCIFEQLAMHDGMGIGYYQTEGSNNLVLNCDAYCNYDHYSEGSYGGNCDGFGFHLRNDSHTGNRIKGCRAWWNSDDGYDLINCNTAVVIEDCWAMFNGYRAGTLDKAGDGTGFKAGGYGMKAKKTDKYPDVVPHHEVRGCLAYNNKNKGFYSNHHLGGVSFINCTALDNPHNYHMICRISREVIRDTLGYDHIVRNCISYLTQPQWHHFSEADPSRCTITNNSFSTSPDGSGSLPLGEKDFLSFDYKELFLPRKADGSLPDIRFMMLNESSKAYGRQMGWQFKPQP